MGRDFSYFITRNPENYPSYDADWNRMDDGRNSWDGPSDDEDCYTKYQMRSFLESYVADLGSYNNVKFTLKAFGQIISEMADDDVVYIQYN